MINNNNQTSGLDQHTNVPPSSAGVNHHHAPNSNNLFLYKGFLPLDRNEFPVHFVLHQNMITDKHFLPEQLFQLFTQILTFEYIRKRHTIPKSLLFSLEYFYEREQMKRRNIIPKQIDKPFKQLFDNPSLFDAVEAAIVREYMHGDDRPWTENEGTIETIPQVLSSSNNATTSTSSPETMQSSVESTSSSLPTHSQSNKSLTTVVTSEKQPENPSKQVTSLNLPSSNSPNKKNEDLQKGDSSQQQPLTKALQNNQPNSSQIDIIPSSTQITHKQIPNNTQKIVSSNASNPLLKQLTPRRVKQQANLRDTQLTLIGLELISYTCENYPKGNQIFKSLIEEPIPNPMLKRPASTMEQNVTNNSIPLIVLSDEENETKPPPEKTRKLEPPQNSSQSQNVATVTNKTQDNSVTSSKKHTINNYDPNKEASTLMELSPSDDEESTEIVSKKTSKKTKKHRTSKRKPIQKPKQQNNDIFFIEYIIRKKILEKSEPIYFVKWLGYAEDSNSWVRESDILDVNLVTSFKGEVIFENERAKKKYEEQQKHKEFQ
nr:unnamed protein product [Naegleria fowleri]